MQRTFPNAAWHAPVYGWPPYTLRDSDLGQFLCLCVWVHVALTRIGVCCISGQHPNPILEFQFTVISAPLLDWI